MLLNNKWGEFFAKNSFLIGLSIDGPEALPNAYPFDRNGARSFYDALPGIKYLQKHGVEWNSLTCVNQANSTKPLEVYKFLKGIGSRFMQFIPIVERKPDAAAAKLGLSLSSPPTREEIERIDK